MSKDIHEIKEKIKKLLALSGSSNTNEAEVAFKQAMHLMRKYNLTEDSVHAREIAIIRDDKPKGMYKKGSIYSILYHMIKLIVPNFVYCSGKDVYNIVFYEEDRDMLGYAVEVMQNHLNLVLKNKKEDIKLVINDLCFAKTAIRSPQQIFEDNEEGEGDDLDLVSATILKLCDDIVGIEGFYEETFIQDPLMDIENIARVLQGLEPIDTGNNKKQEKGLKKLKTAFAQLKFSNDPEDKKIIRRFNGAINRALENYMQGYIISLFGQMAEELSQNELEAIDAACDALQEKYSELSGIKFIASRRTSRQGSSLSTLASNIGGKDGNDSDFRLRQGVSGSSDSNKLGYRG